MQDEEKEKRDSALQEDEVQEVEDTWVDEDVTDTSENTEDEIVLPEIAGLSEIEEYDTLNYDSDAMLQEDLFENLNESLRQQILDMDEDIDGGEQENLCENQKKSKMKKILKITGCIFLVLVMLTAFLVGTKPGKRVLIRIAGHFIEHGLNHEDEYNNLTGIPNPEGTPSAEVTPDPEADATPIPIQENASSIRKEDYVKNILVFGIDQGSMDDVHAGSLNTDTIMIASINTKTKKVHLTSILRDTYVELEDGIGRKINSVFARGVKSGQGPQLLMQAVEKTFGIDIYGYAYVKLNSFEKIIDLLGGVTIELTAKEAEYLNTTNYIVNPAYRNLVAGKNRMNGGQAVGYCRIRKVPTIGGATNDYGRTLRQRRVLNAIFERYKSQGITDLFSITEKCLGYVTTDITNSDGKNQITELLEDLVLNSITEMNSHRLPLNETFYDSGKKGYNGLTYSLVITDEAKNIQYLFQEIYGDTPEEAQANYEKLKR